MGGHSSQSEAVGLCVAEWPHNLGQRQSCRGEDYEGWRKIARPPTSHSNKADLDAAAVRLFFTHLGFSHWSVFEVWVDSVPGIWWDNSDGWLGQEFEWLK